MNNISPFATSNNTNGNSSITMLFNDAPESVKSFMTINYEGSQANIPVFTDVDDQNYFNGDYSNNEGLIDTDDVTDGEYFNLAAKTGWYMDNLTTNLQTCASVYFKNKEDKTTQLSTQVIAQIHLFCQMLMKLSFQFKE